jgi:hypothetical protein
MGWVNGKPTVWALLAFLSLTWSWAPAAAADPEKVSILQAHVDPGDKLVATRSNGSTVTGTFQDLRQPDGRLVLTSFDPSGSRFTPREIALGDITGLTRVETRKSAAWPVFGMVAGAGLGVATGYFAGDDGRSGGDVLVPGNQGPLALALGLTGAFLGLLAGAVLAPSETIETTLW